MHAPVQPRFVASVPLPRGQLNGDQFLWRIVSDPQFSSEMRYCYEHGIPHSHFLGGDADWSPLDRAYVLAYQRYMDERCPDCGWHPLQWPENYRGWVAEPEWVQCQPCRAVESAVNELPNDAPQRGRRVSWRRIPDVPLVPGWENDEA